MKNLTHLKIENRAGKLKLNDGVHKESADKLIEELNQLYGPDAVAAKMVIGEAVCVAEDALETVEVEINSPGGSVLEGTRIFNALRKMSARGVEVTTVVNGLAASMGSVILMAGDKRRMTKGSRIMIHEASMFSWGDARTLKKNAELLEGISSELAGIYADRTGGDAKAIRNLMLAETWMDSEQALANGFVDSIIDYDKKEEDTEAGFDTQSKGMTGILSKLFPGNEHVEQIEAQLAEIETLRADLTAAQARIAELAPLAEANAALQADLSEAQAKLDAADKLASENAQAIAALTEKAQVTDEKISVRASEFLAAQGHPKPVTVEDDGGSNKSHLETFNSLTGAAATAYWKQYQKEIKAEQRAIK